MTIFETAIHALLQENGVELSDMMKSPCLRLHGDFLTMWFDKEESLIIKVSPERVNELISQGKGNEFNYTGKRFKEWVMIPLDYEDEYSDLMFEALEYAKNKKS